MIGTTDRHSSKPFCSRTVSPPLMYPIVVHSTSPLLTMPMVQQEGWKEARGQKMGRAACMYLSEETLIKITSSPIFTLSPSDLCLFDGSMIHHARSTEQNHSQSFHSKLLAKDTHLYARPAQFRKQVYQQAGTKPYMPSTSHSGHV